MTKTSALIKHSKAMIKLKIDLEEKLQEAKDYKPDLCNMNDDQEAPPPSPTDVEEQIKQIENLQQYIEDKVNESKINMSDN